MVDFPRSNTLEIELTSKCTLACPVCPRVRQAKDRERWDNGHLDVDKLIDAVDDKVTKVFFGGSFGDGIYNPDAYKIIEILKQRDIEFNFDTNGSYVKEETWHKIAQAMPDTLQGKLHAIVFSIDGPPDNFTTYRVNGHWPSIERGIRILTEAGKTTRWKYIVFRYNSSFEDIKAAYDKAWELDMRHFMLVHTKRAQPGQTIPIEEFSETLDRMEEYYNQIHQTKDYTKNRPPKLRIQIHPRVRKVTEATKMVTTVKKYENIVQAQSKEGSKEYYETESVYPQCINVKNWAQFIGSNGIYYPCCYMRSEDNRMIEGAGLTPEDLESMSIYNHSVEEILAGPGYRKITDNFENISVCKQKCGKK